MITDYGNIERVKKFGYLGEVIQQYGLVNEAVKRTNIECWREHLQ